MNTQDKYLAALRAGLNRGDAARIAGTSTSSAHRWVKSSPIFALKVKIAIGAAKVAAVSRFDDFLEAAK